MAHGFQAGAFQLGAFQQQQSVPQDVGLSQLFMTVIPRTVLVPKLSLIIILIYWGAICHQQT